METHLAYKCEHVACDVAFGETSSSVGKEVLPFALESPVV